MDDPSPYRSYLEAERRQRLGLITKLRTSIDAASDARQDSNVDDEHDPEGSTIAFELSQASTLLRASSDRLAEIEAALNRLDDGSYGYCAACGNPIPPGRLEALPWTLYCVEHAR
ncbi:TraR/DksA family transcriptional regulator [Arthrobacter sp. H14]|uniref:TraR/DksA family transcriptional regulator n=1 Tax=Arthrobacter sp. H14 TaxID=1312959 RepID=UPI00047E9D59|nr:TraR/DksA C4-type zinc finger protein [Arthrobacter sp. H14]